MIAIVDSGSTKSDWVLIDEKGEEQFRTQTIGFNPYFIGTKEILKELESNPELVAIKSEVSHVYFYGAGCSSEKMNKVV